MNALSIKVLITLTMLVHLGGNFWHGDAHEALEVYLPGFKTAFIVAVILIAPVVGAALVWTRFYLLGCWIVGVSMLGSVLFSVYHHYVMISIDNVEHLPPGTVEEHAHFANSAELIALAALAGVVLAFYGAGKLDARKP